MKTTLAAASFALIAALSGASAAHAASFNDQSAIPAAAFAQTGRQDLSRLPTIHGFNQQSHVTVAAPEFKIGPSRTTMAVDVHCDLPPRVGFNESNSFASC
jgi:hypothetical protein